MNLPPPIASTGMDTKGSETEKKKISKEFELLQAKLKSTMKDNFDAKSVCSPSREVNVPAVSNASAESKNSIERSSIGTEPKKQIKRLAEIPSHMKKSINLEDNSSTQPKKVLPGTQSIPPNLPRNSIQTKPIGLSMEEEIQQKLARRRILAENLEAKAIENTPAEPNSPPRHVSSSAPQKSIPQSGNKAGFTSEPANKKPSISASEPKSRESSVSASEPKSRESSIFASEPENKEFPEASFGAIVKFGNDIQETQTPKIPAKQSDDVNKIITERMNCLRQRLVELIENQMDQMLKELLSNVG